MAYEHFQQITHKQLATIVNNFDTSQDEKDWARYYALVKRPWRKIADAPRKEHQKKKET